MGSSEVYFAVFLFRSMSFSILHGPMVLPCFYMFFIPSPPFHQSSLDFHQNPSAVHVGMAIAGKNGWSWVESSRVESQVTKQLWLLISVLVVCDNDLIDSQLWPIWKCQRSEIRKVPPWVEDKFREVKEHIAVVKNSWVPLSRFRGTLTWVARLVCQGASVHDSIVGREPADEGGVWSRALAKT